MAKVIWVKVNFIQSKNIKWNVLASLGILDQFLPLIVMYFYNFLKYISIRSLQPVNWTWDHWMSTPCPPMDRAPVVTTAPLPPVSSRCFQNETSPFRRTAQPPPLGPPPPPPPPPPPLPPPPPPPPSAMGDPFTRTVQRRSKMRNFNWDAIPRHSVLGKRNVWTSQRNLENFELDTKRMEELFSHTEHQGLVRKGGTVRKSVWGLSQITTEAENVSAFT